MYLPKNRALSYRASRADAEVQAVNDIMRFADMRTSASASSLHNGIPLEKGSCEENGYSELTPTANTTRSEEGANNGAPGGLAPPKDMAALEFE